MNSVRLAKIPILVHLALDDCFFDQLGWRYASTQPYASEIHNFGGARLMALTRRQKRVSSLFLVIALMTFAALIYRAFTADHDARMREYQRRAEAAQPLRKSMVTTDQVVLMTGEAATVNRTRLVYQGERDGIIHLDLYLLDLDSKYPYPKQIPKSAAREGFRLGSGRYQLLTANRKVLTLRILE